MEKPGLEQWRAREVARLLELVETQRRYYQEIVASIPVGLMVLSSDLSIILATAAARNMFRAAGSDSGRRGLNTLLPAWVLDRVEEVLATGVPQTNLVIETERAPQRRLRVAIQAIRNWGEETAQEALVTVEDLTGTSVAPPMADAGPVAASDLIENMDAAIWALRLSDRRFVYINRPAEKLLGFSREEWLENPAFWLDRVHSEDREAVAEAYHHAIERHNSYRGEFRAVSASGRLRWLREHARILLGAEGQPEFLIGMTFDVTERRLVEQQMMQSERAEAVTRLASRMAHDLNNMLMILTGYGEELLNGLPAGSKLRADVQEVLTATERMSGLTGQLLAFARRPPAVVQPMTLEPALRGMMDRVRSAAGEGIAIEWNLADDPQQVKTDAVQLEQALTALVKHASGGTSHVTIETSQVRIRDEIRLVGAPLAPGPYAVITILSSARNGVQKPPSFEWFLPGREVPDDSPALAQAYATLRQWGGDIATSTESGAPGFRVFLPRLNLPAERVAAPAAEPARPPAPAEPKRPSILVVEDEVGIRTLMRKILHRQGYDVVDAANGPDALNIFRRQSPTFDLVVTDMMMPEMTGRELIDKLRAQGFAKKVLYVSGYTDDASVYAGDLPQGTAFLQKPFTLGSLVEKVKEVLAAPSAS